MVKYSPIPQTPGIRVFIKYKNRGEMNFKLQVVDTVLLKAVFLRKSTSYKKQSPLGFTLGRMNTILTMWGWF